jgi:hypothetical protein
LIGLGLAAMGLGMRYQNLVVEDPTKLVYLKWVQLDTPMMLIIVVLLLSLLIGLGLLYLGLAYHHERRHFERQRGHHGETLGARIGE